MIPLILNSYYFKNDRAIDFACVGAHAKVQCVVIFLQVFFMKSTVQTLKKGYVHHFEDDLQNKTILRVYQTCLFMV